MSIALFIFMFILPVIIPLSRCKDRIIELNEKTVALFNSEQYEDLKNFREICELLGEYFKNENLNAFIIIENKSTQNFKFKVTEGSF